MNGPGRTGLRTTRRRTAAVGAVLAVIAPLAALQTTAGAQKAEALTPPVAFTADDLPTWQTNGIVWAMAQADGVVFAGGTFSAVRPPGSPAGTNQQQAAELRRVRRRDGRARPAASSSFTIGSGTATVARAGRLARR